LKRAGPLGALAAPDRGPTPLAHADFDAVRRLEVFRELK
jgi:hypothetical protein